MGFTFPFRFHLALVSIICVALASQAAARTLQDPSMYRRHEEWMDRYGCVYKDDNEKIMRFKIFKSNVERIESFNSDSSKSYKLGINQFADLTNEEFRASRNSFKGMMDFPKAGAFKYGNVSKMPSSIDWRKRGAVTPVKDQGQCGCCWAFSAVAAVEGLTKLKTGKLISLSEQELVDCDIKGEDEGCQGGLMDNAFKFIKENHGINTEKNYPYVGTDGKCNAKSKSRHFAKIKGHEEVPENNEEALTKAVARQPVSVAIDAAGFEFQFYKEGVFGGGCGTDLDHGVAVVGYGVDEGVGKKYWLVKNSWGDAWGEEGYIRMQRDVDAKEGMCGIAMQASYPIA